MRILLAVDSSKYSDAVLDTLIAQVRPEGTEVRVLHVLELAPIFQGGQEWGAMPDWVALQQEQLKAANVLVERAEKKLREAGYQVTTAIEEGNPKAVIVDAAAHWRADLVMVGSHGRRGLDRFLLGSVSEAVARHAPCSVEIVRLPAKAPGQTAKA